jgi:hypothetical protein
MEWKAEFRRLPQYLAVTASGEWTESNIVKFIADIRRESDLAGTPRILLDLRGILRPENEMVRYLSGIHLAKMFDPRHKISAIGAPGNVNHFAENVAANRGTRIRVFTDERAAVDWLLAD